MDDAARSVSPRIGLALSGGGIRAAVFHLGVLRQLAEGNLLEDVTQISTVSGGSLVTGAIFAHAGGRWPSSADFLGKVYPSIREMLTTTDLFSLKALGVRGVLRENFRLVSGRAGILSRLLHQRWRIRMKFSDLPKSPLWHINTTCIETGKNWRFSQEAMGDWQFGRRYSPEVAVADAIAASAAVPYVIGAMPLTISPQGWWQTDPATKEPIQKVKPRFQKVHLWDGGAYENMALEALYKPAGGLQNFDALICSDASGPLGEPETVATSLLAGRLASPRLFDIASDQIRALRSRVLMKSIESNEIEGYLLRIGVPARKFGLRLPETDDYLTDAACDSCLTYPTTLTQIETDDFDRIARHGSEAVHLTIGTHSTNPYLKSRAARRPGRDGGET
ncbi:patatin-like phospholipase family protein [Aurantimonas sp.]|uniref:patatin-like phospholipase family protein n=1 Tax=Aurantimonas sp. TaxID=1872654 RepID=UPI003518BCB2